MFYLLGAVYVVAGPSLTAAVTCPGHAITEVIAVASPCPSAQRPGATLLHQHVCKNPIFDP